MVILSNRRSKWVCITVIFFAVTLSGCADSMHYGAVKITSTPTGAEVVNLKDDSSLGITPARVSFSGEAGTAEFVTVQLRKKGYLDRITSFWLNRRHDNPVVADENAIDIHVELEKSNSD